MKILLLCDRESAKNDLRATFYDLLADAGHTVTVLTLNREEFKPCLGCFGCWVKTPGQCVITEDDANSVSEKLMRSDAVVLLTKITFGGFSADVKSFLDRAIQNIAADFEVYKGEMRHEMRYERFPIYIAVGYGDVSGSEQQTFINLAQRNALNMRPANLLALTTQSGDTFEKTSHSILKLLEASK